MDKQRLVAGCGIEFVHSPAGQGFSELVTVFPARGSRKGKIGTRKGKESFYA